MQYQPESSPPAAVRSRQPAIGVFAGCALGLTAGALIVRWMARRFGNTARQDATSLDPAGFEVDDRMRDIILRDAEPVYDGDRPEWLAPDVQLWTLQYRDYENLYIDAVVRYRDDAGQWMLSTVTFMVGYGGKVWTHPPEAQPEASGSLDDMISAGVMHPARIAKAQQREFVLHRARAALRGAGQDAAAEVVDRALRRSAPNRSGRAKGRANR